MSLRQIILLTAVVIIIMGFARECSAIDWRGIVVHVSDSEIMTKEDCDEWHNEQGWAGCGYNFIIQKDGNIDTARGFDKVGAHAKGYNRTHLGVCFVGVPEVRLTQAQLEAFRRFYTELPNRFRLLPVIPHFRVNPFKECPGKENWEQIRSVLSERD